MDASLFRAAVILVETIAVEQQDVEMLSEEDLKRTSIYHVPDKPCPPYTFDRIRKTLPSNLMMLPSAAEPNVSYTQFSFALRASAISFRIFAGIGIWL